MSLINTLKEKQILWQPSFTDESAYRGDLILMEGKISPSGNQNPPEILVKQSVLTIAGDKITFLAGSLHKIEELKDFCEVMLPYCDDSIPFYMFVENIGDEMAVEANGRTFYCYPLDEGTVWGEMSELTGLEKGDFKGMSAPEKVVKLADEANGMKIKGDTVSFDDAKQKTIEVHKEARGPV